MSLRLVARRRGAGGAGSGDRGGDGHMCHSFLFRRSRRGIALGGEYLARFLRRDAKAFADVRTNLTLLSVAIYPTKSEWLVGDTSGVPTKERYESRSQSRTPPPPPFSILKAVMMLSGQIRKPYSTSCANLFKDMLWP